MSLQKELATLPPNSEIQVLVGNEWIIGSVVSTGMEVMVLMRNDTWVMRLDVSRIPAYMVRNEAT